MAVLVAYASKHGSTPGIAPRDHRVLYGALDTSVLGFAERMIAKAAKAPTGDFRDWEAIRVWAEGIAEELD